MHQKRFHAMMGDIDLWLVGLPWGSRDGHSMGGSLHTLMVGRRLAGALAVFFLFAGCSPGPQTLAASDSMAVAEPVFAVGYGRIAEIYLQPMDMRRLGLDGLKGLHTLDARLDVERVGEMVRLFIDGRPFAEYTAPGAGDAEAWAGLTARAVERSRHVSPILRQATAEQIYQAIFDAVMLDLDGYSRYSGTERATTERAQREGYGGIGVTVGESGGKVVVTGLVPRSPADRAGLQEGEALLALDGDAVAAMNLPEVRDRLRGPPGSLILVTAGADSTAARQLTLRRERVIPGTVTIAVDHGIGFLKVERFNASTARNLRDAVNTVRRTLGPDAVGFVLDLRGNPGGLLDQAVAVADLFIPRGRIISTEGRHPDSRQMFEATTDDIAEGLPLVVLLDGRSASAAEIVAAALQDTGRAVIVGAASFGKGSVQTVTRLPNDGELFLTWSRLYAPSGYTLHRQGVVPTICTSHDDTDVAGVLARVRAGQPVVPAALASWRAAAPDDESALAHLRETCPWKAHPADLDLRVAKAVLADRVLYQRALATTTTAVAER